MKKLSQLRVITVLLVGTLVPVGAQAKEEGFNLKALLAPLTAQLGGKPAVAQDALVKSLKEKTAEIEKEIGTTQEESKLRAEVEELNARNEKIKTTDSLVEAFNRNKQEEAKAANEEMAALHNRMKGVTSEGVTSKDSGIDAVEATCSKGVDVARFTSLDSQMRTGAAQHLLKEGAKAMDAATKEEKEAALAAYLKKINEIKAANHKRGMEEEMPAEEDKLAYLDLNKPEGFTAEQRIDRLSADKARLEKELITGTDKQLDTLSKLYRDLLAPKEDKNKAETLAAVTAFADEIQGYRRSLHEAGLAAVKKAFKNCEMEAKEVGRDQALAPNTALNKAYQAVLAYYGGEQNSYASPFFAALSKEARVMQCTKSSAKVEDLLGAKVQARIESLKNPALDRKAILQGAMGVLKELGANSKQVAQSLKKPLKQCDTLAKFKQKIEKFVGGIQQGMPQQAAGPQLAGAGGLGARRAAPAQVTPAATHANGTPAI